MKQYEVYEALDGIIELGGAAMEFRVGDIVADITHGGVRSVITRERDGLFAVKHLTFDGWESQLCRRPGDLKIIKATHRLDIGDKVWIKSENRVGEIVETNRWGNDRLSIKVEYAGGYNFDVIENPSKRKVIQVRRQGAAREEFPLRGKLVKVIAKGGRKHNFRNGDVCKVDARIDDGGSPFNAVFYVLIRVSDGFEQVVTRSSFEEIAQQPIDAPYVSVDEMFAEPQEQIQWQGNDIPFSPKKGERYELAKGWSPILWNQPDGTPKHFLAGHAATVTQSTIHGVAFIMDGGYPVTLQIENFCRIFKAIKDEEETDMTENGLQVQTEMAAKIKALEEQNEQLRRKNVEDTFGEVTERHLWTVVIIVPSTRSRFFSGSPGERQTEVVTEGKNMVEAAMVAESMAKQISAESYVKLIDYQRVLGAVK